MRNFENLVVWKRACQLACAVYATVGKNKDYALVNQMTRAAISIPSNITEGSERRSPKEFINFLYIARGSAGELRTQIYIADKIGIISHEQQIDLTAKAKEVSKMLFALINRLDGNQSTLPLDEN